MSFLESFSPGIFNIDKQTLVSSSYPYIYLINLFIFNFLCFFSYSREQRMVTLTGLCHKSSWLSVDLMQRAKLKMVSTYLNVKQISQVLFWNFWTPIQTLPYVTFSRSSFMRTDQQLHDTRLWLRKLFLIWVELDATRAKQCILPTVSYKRRK